MRFLLAFVLLLAAPVAHAQLQLPALTGRVVDEARILSPQAVSELEAKLAAHEQATSSQVVVATVPSLQGYDIARFANELYRAWQLGQADRDNGVLLLVAPNERQVRIEVGYGLEGALTDALSADIIRNRIVPRFRANDFAGGVTAGTEAILAVIRGEYEAEPKRPEAQDYLPWGFILLWLVFMLIGMWRRGGYGFRRRGGFAVPMAAGWYAGTRAAGGFGGGGFGGGGFSGGGGSSGGGGASGSW